MSQAVAFTVDEAVSKSSEAPTVVLSNSLGSAQATWCPQVVALRQHFRVVRYDTRGRRTSPLPPGPYTIEDRAILVRSEGAARSDAVVRRWYTEGFARRHPDRIEGAHAMISATPAEGYASCCEAIATMDLTADLPRIVAPDLAIAGADDPVTPPPHLKAIAETVADDRMIEVLESAHLASDEQPSVINRALIQFLTGGEVV